MGNITQIENTIVLLDDYSAESKKLHTSFKLADKKYPVFVIDDEGFLPEDVTSVFGSFLGDFKASSNALGKPRYFNQIQVPAYWEISGNNTSGKVHDLDQERARIFYAEPKNKRIVKTVDWLDKKGVVRSSDHYNCYGALYARTIFNAQGKKVNKSYFSATGEEIIMENYVTHNIILNENNQVMIFANKKEFVCYFLKKHGYELYRILFNTLSTSFFVSQAMPDNGKKDILFWQEPVRPDIPGNMRIILDGNSNRTEKIVVQNQMAYDKLVELGASQDVLDKMGYIYPFSRHNRRRPEILICTNSDRVAQINMLVEALPDMNFHLVAITEMSSKLMDMEQYANVTLYPSAKTSQINELFDKCDYYLDINYENEIVSAVYKAFLHNQVIVAFHETLHNPNYVAPEHIFNVEKVNEMISYLQALCKDTKAVEEHLLRQKKWAMAENKETYSII